MNSKELKATFGLGAVYALRMLGVFMVLPIFELYAKGLPQHPGQAWITAAMIASALAQALFQILLGRLSDRIGRKPVIAMGMLMFALGSYIAGSSDRIELITLGRFLQGAGAISSAVTALLADVTREEVRTMAMAIMGAGMGLSFVLAIVLGSAAEDLLGGVRGIFKLTAVLSLVAIPVVWLAVPAPEHRNTAAAPTGSLAQVFADTELLRLSGGILLLHAAVLCLFTGMPLLIQQEFGWASDQHWKLYLPVLVGTLVFALPLMRRADRGGARGLLLGSIVLLAAGLLVAGLVPGKIGLIAGLILFFLPFNLLEGLLPSLVSRRAPPDQKGAALGVYATAQFLGQPVGGLVCVWALSHHGPAGLLAVAAMLPLLWLCLAYPMRPTPPRARDSEAAAHPST
ncbi:MAG: MFS transporter [Nevskia sp.]|nr:MFS transporter [Nevskia sp.]